MKKSKLHAGPPIRIAVFLQNHFSVRDFIFTPVWEEMEKRKEIHFLLLYTDSKMEKLINTYQRKNITFLKFPPRKSKLKSTETNFNKKELLARRWLARFMKYDKTYIFDSLMYRFAAINNLSHYKIRKHRSLKERRKHQIFRNYKKGEESGRPFPESTILFRLLYEFRHGFLNMPLQEDINAIKNMNLDLFVFGRIHLYSTAYWANVLRRAGISQIGVVNSWDHPTVQGPTPRGMSGYIVASRRMVDEMTELHGIQSLKLCQVGKVQMDIFKKSSFLKNRPDFLKEMGIPEDHRLITLGTNTATLKEHEISISKKMARNLLSDTYGKTSLLIRTHPQDKGWIKDFKSLERKPWIICTNANSFGNRLDDNILRGREDQIELANIARHSDIVIQSRGSLALDAIAFDTPVISLAFDGDLIKSKNDSFLLEYDYEHYKPLVAAKGTWMVGSYSALDDAIQSYLNNPKIHSEGRRKIRDEQLEPLNGKASERLVEYLVKSAIKAREGDISEGDWKYKGFGDVTWSFRQTCKASTYVKI